MFVLTNGINLIYYIVRSFDIEKKDARYRAILLANCPTGARRDVPGISLEGMMLKLKLQYFGHLMRRVDSLE